MNKTNFTLKHRAVTISCLSVAWCVY